MATHFTRRRKQLSIKRRINNRAGKTNTQKNIFTKRKITRTVVSAKVVQL